MCWISDGWIALVGRVVFLKGLVYDNLCKSKL